MASPSPNHSSLAVQLRGQIDSVSKDLSERLRAANCSPESVSLIEEALDGLDNQVLNALKNQDLLRSLQEPVGLFEYLSESDHAVSALSRALQSAQGNDFATQLKDICSNGNRANQAFLYETLLRLTEDRRHFPSDPQSGEFFYGTPRGEILSRRLLENSPATWLRMMRELPDPSGALIAGKRYPLARDEVNKSPVRATFRQKWFECAFNKAFSPDGYTYDFKGNDWVSANGAPALSSLDPGTLSKVLSHFLNSEVVTVPKLDVSGSSSSSGSGSGSTLSQLTDARGGSGTSASGSTTPSSQTDDWSIAPGSRARHHLLYLFQGLKEPSVIVAEVKLNGLSTFVEVLGADKGRVTFFNLKSPANAAEGQEIAGRNPPRRLENFDRRHESMAEDAFMGSLERAYVSELQAPKSVDEILEYLQKDPNCFTDSKIQTAVSTKLESIPKAARLCAVDSLGISVAENVMRLISTFPTPSTDRDALLSNVINRAADPGVPKEAVAGIDGGERVQLLLELVNNAFPGEWSRLTMDLLLRGTSSARGGRLQRPGVWLRQNNSSDLVDDALVSTFMQLAAPQGFSYNSEKRVFQKNGEPDQPAKFTEDDFSKALARFFPADTVLVGKSAFKNQQSLESAIRNGIQAEADRVCVRVNWKTAANPDGARSLRITKIENGRVFFTDPSGKKKKDQGISSGGLSRRTEKSEEGLYSASIKDLFNNLQGLVIDKKALTPDSRPAQSWLRRCLANMSFGGTVRTVRPLALPVLLSAGELYVGFSADGANRLVAFRERVVNQPWVQKASSTVSGAAGQAYDFLSSLKIPQFLGLATDSPQDATGQSNPASSEAPAVPVDPKAVPPPPAAATPEPMQPEAPASSTPQEAAEPTPATPSESPLDSLQMPPVASAAPQTPVDAAPQNPPTPSTPSAAPLNSAQMPQPAAPAPQTPASAAPKAAPAAPPATPSAAPMANRQVPAPAPAVPTQPSPSAKPAAPPKPAPYFIRKPEAPAPVNRSDGTLQSLFQRPSAPQQVEPTNKPSATVSSLGVGRRFESIKSQAAEMILEELKDSDAVFMAIDIEQGFPLKRPTKNLDSLKGVGETLAKYRAVWKQIDPSGTAAQRLENRWIVDPERTLESYQRIYGKAAVQERARSYERVKQTLKPMLETYLEETAKRFEDAGLTPPRIKLETADQTLDTLREYRQWMILNKQFVPKGEGSGPFSLHEILWLHNRIVDFIESPSKVANRLAREQQ